MNPIPQAVARTPLHEWHVRHGVVLEIQDGWYLPASAGVNISDGLILTDQSTSAKFHVLGKEAASIAGELAGSTDLRANEVREIESAYICSLAPDRIGVYANSTNATGLHNLLIELCEKRKAELVDMTGAEAAFNLSGHEVEAVLRRLTPLDVSPAGFPPGTCAATIVVGIRVLLLRPRAPSREAVRIYVPWDLAEYLWSTITEVAGNLT
jgi:heterotetrameric sarcosine oxidase gamma subunit